MNNYIEISSYFQVNGIKTIPITKQEKPPIDFLPFTLSENMKAYFDFINETMSKIGITPQQAGQPDTRRK